MPLIDISLPLREGTPEWPGETPFACGWTWRIERGDNVNVSAINTSPHVGTHADSPRHVKDGWPGIDEVPLESFVGPACVADVRGRDGILELTDLALPAGGAAAGRLLLRTGHTVADGRFPASWPVLSETCVHALLAQGLRLVGVDAPSVDPRYSATLDVHRLLFENGACILENLDLRSVEPGIYELIAAPIKLEGLDAAPVRAMLRPLHEKA
jgi:arylformamidase